MTHSLADLALSFSPAAWRRGLRWNLADMEMRFGRLVSTSNLIAEDEVYVESDADLVWTTQLHTPGQPK